MLSLPMRGIVIDLSPFRKILYLNKPQKTVTVQAGARWGDIDIVAKKEGLCLMTYPSSKFSTVGGWIATGGYGINSFRYGHLTKTDHIDVRRYYRSGESKKITPNDPEFEYFVSTEGVFGIIVEVNLKLRDVPEASYPHLFYFPTTRRHLPLCRQFMEKGQAAETKPNAIRFLDAVHLSDINEIMHARMSSRKAPGCCLSSAAAEDDGKFLKFMEETGGVEEAPRYVASYLWNERLFGMKTKRLGPTILASECIIPIASAAEFIEKAKILGSHFGVEDLRRFLCDRQKNTLIMTNFLCDSRKTEILISICL